MCKAPRSTLTLYRNTSIPAAAFSTRGTRPITAPAGCGDGMLVRRRTVIGAPVAPPNGAANARANNSLDIVQYSMSQFSHSAPVFTAAQVGEVGGVGEVGVEVTPSR